MGGFYMQYLESLCRRRGWTDPSYECYRDPKGFTCLVLVNGREYQTDLAYESDVLAQENAAMRAFMVCRNFSVNGGMLARNGIVQGLPATADTGRRRRSRHAPARDVPDGRGRRSGHHSSSSSTASFD
ncbi:double strand RNA binding from dead end protein 1 domain-containing protein [Ophiocordyceps camponoti-floridani]|uniref:Double strand RNA binding from dead end protein 1 domain-containing protein n=1 Tax=Ophiocordyceps camponoti-floridani TaxID=2030778 RepID=A0A8H4QE88_9HYPO|nr:double strand RNA binding from dead end protein 1 domain-containing protein [Ophiocordyceps camponoti-floridani]